MDSLIKYMSRNKAALFGLADIVLVALSLFLAFLARFDGRLPLEYQERFFLYFAIIAILNLSFLGAERLYSFAWEFVSLRELARLLRAITYANAIFALIVFIGRENILLFEGFPRSIIFINYVFNLIFLGGVRIGKRVWREVIKKRPVTDLPRVLVVGAGPEGEQLVRNLLKSEKSNLYPVGIIDHGSEKSNISIHGVRIIGLISDIPKIVRDQNIEHIIIALGAAEGNIIREAVKHSREAGIKHVKIIPDTHELLSGRVTLTDFREIQIEDILGRNPAQIDTERIRDFLRGKRVLVTGAAGSIGSELCRQILAFSAEKLIALDFNESGLFEIHEELKRLFPEESKRVIPIVTNINDGKKLLGIMKKYEPHLIFHAAAYKHVPLMEDFPEEAVQTNVFGTLNIAEAAIEAGSEKFVLISTDKAIKPVSVMGQTKRAAEIIVQDLNNHGKTKFVAVRFGNVIGSRGSVVPLFQEQIRKRSPLTITHPEMTRYFMTIPEAALLVMEAGAVGDGGEIFMLDMGHPVKILDIAKEMIRLAGYRPDIDVPIVFTGTRPGEKIFEEIVSDEEREIGQTQWDKILITKNEHPRELSFVKTNLLKLKNNLNHSAESLRKALQEFIS